jgi:hypothetical protein
LACIRLVLGGVALLAPGFLAQRVGVDANANPGITYFVRMFGIRTVLIGAELRMQTGERRAEALRRAVLIHAADTMAAYLASRRPNFPKQGRAVVWISGFNTLLAIIANR